MVCTRIESEVKILRINIAYACALVVYARETVRGNNGMAFEPFRFEIFEGIFSILSKKSKL